ncbi:hypothetical protein EOPP23_16925 [Endozoicomonas sp. OPT23]|uniref:hypothetical protein n=1 Tax=Endozoicomonas sp. OPT23 TaxID=2072845 RepID=UPI00129A0C84|nr:hypothetical protein [Endozoicomonas sp. OPT23]MRI34669.1 hypothetical protein [Endozoicomonas sp. OPT23]
MSLKKQLKKCNLLAPYLEGSEFSVTNSGCITAGTCSWSVDTFIDGQAAARLGVPDNMLHQFNLIEAEGISRKAGKATTHHPFGDASTQTTARTKGHYTTSQGDFL